MLRPGIAKAFGYAFVSTAGLCALIVVGSRRLTHFDSALVVSTRKTSGESDLGRPVSVVAESRLRVSPQHSPFYCRFQ